VPEKCQTQVIPKKGKKVKSGCPESRHVIGTKPCFWMKKKRKKCEKNEKNGDTQVI
jgi:hypothetical protein